MLDGLESLATSVQALIEGQALRRGNLRTACAIVFAIITLVVARLVIFSALART